MQQTVWNVHKEMENIGVMESVNGKMTLNNVNSKKVLMNNVVHLCFKKNFSFFKISFFKRTQKRNSDALLVISA